MTGLLVPGLVVSLRKSRMQRIIAAGWLLGFFAMHVVHLREVRYIAFLAPLSAFVIVPVVRSVLQSKRLFWLATLALIGRRGTNWAGSGGNYTDLLPRQSDQTFSRATRRTRRFAQNR